MQKLDLFIEFFDFLEIGGFLVIICRGSFEPSIEGSVVHFFSITDSLYSAGSGFPKCVTQFSILKLHYIRVLSCCGCAQRQCIFTLFKELHIFLKLSIVRRICLVLSDPAAPLKLSMFLHL